ncbi:MAG TPA: hypothetical protein DCL15_16815, partial [Chloroflexi bacterium]|nr:hypothetical protein [Chloroflexota bacterium]
MVFDLEEDPLGRIWAITGAGATYFDAQRWRQPATLHQLGATSIGVLKTDELGMWIGTAKGLAYFRFDDESMTLVQPLAGRSINAIELDSLSRLWVADAEGAIWRRDVDGAWKPVGGLDGVTAPVTAFHPESEPSGAMLAAFKGYGVYRTRGVGWEAVDKNRRVSSDRIFAVLEDATSIWVGSEAGLIHLDPYGSVLYDAQDGLAPGAIRAIAQDMAGAYWFGGDRGIFYYVPERGRPW